MLGPLTDTIHGVVNFTWPMLIISIVIMVSVRLTYLIKEKQKTTGQVPGFGKRTGGADTPPVLFAPSGTK